MEITSEIQYFLCIHVWDLFCESPNQNRTSVIKQMHACRAAVTWKFSSKQHFVLMCSWGSVEERGSFLPLLSQGQSAVALLCSVIQREAQQEALCRGGQHGKDEGFEMRCELGGKWRSWGGWWAFVFYEHKLLHSSAHLFSACLADKWWQSQNIRKAG